MQVKPAKWWMGCFFFIVVIQTKTWEHFCIIQGCSLEALKCNFNMFLPILHHLSKQKQQQKLKRCLCTKINRGIKIVCLHTPQVLDMNSTRPLCFCVSILRACTRWYNTTTFWFPAQANSQNTVITQWTLQSMGNLKFPLQQTSEFLEKWEEGGFTRWTATFLENNEQVNSTHRGCQTRRSAGERNNSQVIDSSFVLNMTSWFCWRHSKLLAVSWLSFTPNSLYASFEQKLISKDAGEIANLDAGLP